MSTHQMQMEKPVRALLPEELKELPIYFSRRIKAKDWSKDQTPYVVPLWILSQDIPGMPGVSLESMHTPEGVTQFVKVTIPA